MAIYDGDVKEHFKDYQIEREHIVKEKYILQLWFTLATRFPR